MRVEIRKQRMHMKYQKVRLGLSVFAISGLVFFNAAPFVSAHGNEPGGDSVSAQTETETQTDTTTTVDQTKVEDRMNQSRGKAKQELATLRANKPVKTTEQRQKACEQRKVSINNRITAYNNAANTKLTQFNTIFERVKKFKTDKALKVTNYDQLVATATEKQTAATEAVAALKDLSADFDCTSTDPAATVASIKTATADARTALKDYRTAIKNIVVALAQVNKTSNSTSTDSTTDTTTTTTTEAQ